MHFRAPAMLAELHAAWAAGAAVAAGTAATGPPTRAPVNTSPAIHRFIPTLPSSAVLDTQRERRHNRPDAACAASGLRPASSADPVEEHDRPLEQETGGVLAVRGEAG